MQLVSQPASIAGSVRIPASKSHMVRALFIATLANGTSTLRNPLSSGDTNACRATCAALGATIRDAETAWIVTGTGGALATPKGMIDVGNSGTTLYVALSVAALADHAISFTGDYQIQRRSAQPLLTSLRQLGASAVSLSDNGCAPIRISGPLRGGATSIECPTSQYLSSLLLACPLGRGTSEIAVPLLNEQPYVEMTLDWLARQDIVVEHAGMAHFVVQGCQKYKPFDRDIPADFSSATFFLVAAAITGGDVTLKGLDMRDTQGDKAVVGMLGQMGAKIESGDDFVRVHGGSLKGIDLDLNATPDALPAMAVAGCFASGTTRIHNVAQARIKETDRIAVMTRELRALGADIEEQPDGLIVRESALNGGTVHGHDDHRIVMAMVVAGLRAKGPIVVDSAEAMRVTFPSFAALMQSLGASVELRAETAPA